MNTKLSRTFAAIVVLAIIMAVPVAYALQNRTNLLKIERSEQHKLQLQIDSVEKQLHDRDQTIQQKESEIKQLQSDLQAKRSEEARIAKAQASTMPVAVSRGGCESYRSLVSQYDWDVDVALEVMRAESGCNANSANWSDGHADIGCTGSFGLFQLNCGFGKIFDPADNIAKAYGLYSVRGWQPWSVCTTGKVACG